jgi:TrpR-related protein YerC/YecD
MSTKNQKQIGEDKVSSEKRLDRLYGALLSLKNKEECAVFLRDLCTVSELEAMGERLAIAERVAKDESYLSIAGDLGASTTTVTRVAHWLNHGMGGYRAVLNRLKK